MHEPGNVPHGLAAAEDERPVPARWAARRLGMDANEAEMVEQPGVDLAEAPPRGRRHGKGWITKPRKLHDRSQLGVRIGQAVRLVGEEHGGKPQREGILIAPPAAAPADSLPGPQRWVRVQMRLCWSWISATPRVPEQVEAVDAILRERRVTVHDPVPRARDDAPRRHLLSAREPSSHLTRALGTMAREHASDGIRRGLRPGARKPRMQR